jgi:hypothetical protein
MSKFTRPWLKGNSLTLSVIGPRCDTASSGTKWLILRPRCRVVGHHASAQSVSQADSVLCGYGNVETRFPERLLAYFQGGVGAVRAFRDHSDPSSDLCYSACSLGIAHSRHAKETDALLELTPMLESDLSCSLGFIPCRTKSGGPMFRYKAPC